MDRFPQELIYGLIFAAILLYQYLMKRFAPREQPQFPQDEQLEQIPEEAKETPAAFRVSGVAAGHFGRTGAPSASLPLARRRFSRRSLLGTRREVQNAIVIATILGPCRAYEPHDVR